MRNSFILTIAAITISATVAFAQMAPTKTGESAKGKVLTSDKSMTLYVLKVLEKLEPTESTTLAIKRGSAAKSESHHCFERHPR